MTSVDAQETPGQLASAASTEVIINLNKVNKWYGDFHVLKDIDLVVHKGERIVICGPSGSGKSTLIRCINRLEEHQQGDIVVDGMTPWACYVRSVGTCRGAGSTRNRCSSARSCFSSSVSSCRNTAGIWK